MTSPRHPQLASRPMRSVRKPNHKKTPKVYEQGPTAKHGLKPIRSK